MSFLNNNMYKIIITTWSTLPAAQEWRQFHFNGSLMPWIMIVETLLLWGYLYVNVRGSVLYCYFVLYLHSPKLVASIWVEDGYGGKYQVMEIISHLRLCFINLICEGKLWKYFDLNCTASTKIDQRLLSYLPPPLPPHGAIVVGTQNPLKSFPYWNPLH